jgi:hypothetical protein
MNAREAKEAQFNFWFGPENERYYDIEPRDL